MMIEPFRDTTRKTDEQEKRFHGWQHSNGASRRLATTPGSNP